MLALRAFMFERVYLGEHARGGARAGTRHDLDASSGTSSSAATPRTRSAPFVSGMTDRFALAYAERV